MEQEVELSLFTQAIESLSFLGNKYQWFEASPVLRHLLLPIHLCQSPILLNIPKTLVPNTKDWEDEHVTAKLRSFRVFQRQALWIVFYIILFSHPLGPSQRRKQLFENLICPRVFTIASPSLSGEILRDHTTRCLTFGWHQGHGSWSWDAVNWPIWEWSPRPQAQ